MCRRHVMRYGCYQSWKKYNINKRQRTTPRYSYYLGKWEGSKGAFLPGWERGRLIKEIYISLIPSSLQNTETRYFVLCMVGLLYVVRLCPFKLKYVHDWPLPSRGFSITRVLIVVNERPTRIKNCTFQTKTQKGGRVHKNGYKMWIASVLLSLFICFGKGNKGPLMAG